MALAIEVADDEVGFEQPTRLDDLARRGHDGLLGMAERATPNGARRDPCAGRRRQPCDPTGLESLLDLTADIEVVAVVADGREAVHRTTALEPDVVLLDVRIPVVDGVRAARALSDRARVLILTYSDAEEVVVGAIRAGASGYLVHGRFEPDELIDAVHDVAAGRTVLCPTIAPVVFDARRSQPERTAANAAAGITAREREVMTRIATGMSNRVIAAKVFLSENTVKNHVNDVYGKLRVRSRAEAIALWLSATDTNHDGL